MNSKKNIGFDVLDDNNEKVISYRPASFSLWLHIPLLLVLAIIYSLNTVFALIVLVVWIGITIKSLQKNEIIIEKNKFIIGNDSFNINQIKGFILTNFISNNRVKVGLSEVIRRDELINKVEIDEFLQNEKFKKAFQINMIVGNTEKRLVWNLNKEQARSFIYYFSQGQYLLSEQDESTMTNQEKKE